MPEPNCSLSEGGPDNSSACAPGPEKPPSCSCLQCGGTAFYRDQEDPAEVWRCINCGRPAPGSNNNHNGEAELNLAATAEVAKAPEASPPEPEQPVRSYEVPSDKAWYASPQIRFTIDEVIWILRNAELLHEGVWPPDPAISGYTTMPSVKKKRGGKNAPFTKAVEVIAEVERRLEHCGLDGLMVYLYYTYDFDDQRLTKFFRVREDEVRYRIDAIVWHISRWKYSTKYPYRRWLVYRNYDNYKSKAAPEKTGAGI
jgi:hypothetical protein